MEWACIVSTKLNDARLYIWGIVRLVAKAKASANDAGVRDSVRRGVRLLRVLMTSRF